MFNLFKKQKVAEAIKNLTQALADETTETTETVEENLADETPAEEEAPTNVTEYSEAQIKVSERTFGGKVELIEGEELLPFPDGDFRISGDDNVYTAKEGFITAINGEEAPAEEPAEEPAAEEMAEEVVEEAPAGPSEIEVLKAQVEALTQMVTDMQSMLAGFAKQEDVASFSTQITELNETIKKAMTIPAEFSRTNNSNVIKDSNKEAQKNLKALFGVKN